MEITKQWVTDWKIGENVERESELGNELVTIFTLFCEQICLAQKSKTTQNRHRGALHALGGYIVEQGIYENTQFSAMQLLLDNCDEDGGPLIHIHNETWQREVDTVCKKLFRYLQSVD